MLLRGFAQSNVNGTQCNFYISTQLKIILIIEYERAVTYKTKQQ